MHDDGSLMPTPPVVPGGSTDLRAIAEALSAVAQRAGGIDGRSPLEES